MLTKSCKTCKQEKSLIDFYKHKKMLDGHLNICKECKKKSQKKYRRENLEKARASCRASQQKRKERFKEISVDISQEKICGSCKTTKSLKYFPKHPYTPDKVGTSCLDCKKTANYLYKSKRRKKLARDSRLYYRAHKNDLNFKLARRATAHSRRLKMKNNSKNTKLKKEDITLIFDMYCHTCCYCGRKENLTIDHITPVSKGGDNSFHNLTCACGKCNSSKSNKNLLVWFAEGVKF